MNAEWTTITAEQKETGLETNIVGMLNTGGMLSSISG
jgi:hypothetical protein